MADVLSRSEMESLLTALDGHTGPRGDGAGSRGLPTSAAAIPGTRTSGATDQARAAVLFVEELRREFQLSWQEFLRGEVIVKRQMPAQSPLKEVLRGAEERLIFVIEAEQAQGDLLLSVERSLAAALLHRLLGGSQPAEALKPVTRLTDLEHRLLTQALLESFAGAHPPTVWRLIGVVAVDSLAELAHWDDRGVWWEDRWEFRAAGVRGSLSLATACDFLGALPRRRSPEDIDAAADTEPRPTEAGTSEVVVEWGQITDPAPVTEWQVGQLLATGLPADAPVRILVDGAPRFAGRAGTLEDRRAVSLTGDLPQAGAGNAGGVGNS